MFSLVYISFKWQEIKFWKFSQICIFFSYCSQDAIGARQFVVNITEGDSWEDGWAQVEILASGCQFQAVITTGKQNNGNWQWRQLRRLAQIRLRQNEKIEKYMTQYDTIWRVTQYWKRKVWRKVTQYNMWQNEKIKKYMTQYDKIDKIWWVTQNGAMWQVYDKYLLTQYRKKKVMQ